MNWALGESHDGIIELPDDAPVGQSYADYAGLDDPVIEVSVTPDRADCMGVRGIARDLAAAGMGTLRPLAEVYGMDSLSPIAGDGSACPILRLRTPTVAPPSSRKT